MKKEYKALEIEIYLLERKDVICTSDGNQNFNDPFEGTYSPSGWT